MNFCNSKFKATVLKDLGYTHASDDLIHRVLIVRDEYKNIKVCLQAWWLDGSEWKPGKGYFLSSYHAKQIGRCMGEAVDHIDFECNINITNTQSYKVTKEQDGRITIEKWWRKSESEPWTLGKSLSIDGVNVAIVSRLLDEAGSQTLHVR